MHRQRHRKKKYFIKKKIVLLLTNINEGYSKDHATQYKRSIASYYRILLNKIEIFT